MSGPKSYSISVFKGGLKTIFHLQSEIKLLWDELNNKKISDKNRCVQVDCNDFIRQRKNLLNELIEPIHEKLTGRLDQQQFDLFYNKVRRSTEKLLLFKTSIREEIEHFSEIENSYELHLEFEKIVNFNTENFNIIKQQFTAHLKKNLENKYQDKLKKILKEFENINLDFELPAFDENFSSLFDTKKTELTAVFENRKQELNRLISKYFGSGTGSTSSKKVSLFVKDEKSGVGRIGNIGNPERLEGKIIELISGLNDKKLAGFYKNRLLDLLNDNSKTEPYYYIELYEEIRETVKQAAFVEDLQNALSEADKIIFDKELKPKIISLKQKIFNLLEKDRIKKNDTDIIFALLKELKAGEKDLLQKQLLMEKERQYIKSLLVMGLQDLNYEVKTDMKVIDFEKTDAFMLEVPEQDNFLNIRFNRDGSMLYNFLIPENRENLGHEQKEKRLAEMEQTCSEFKNLLKKLKRQGLNINLTKEINVSEKALIRIPPKFSKLIKQKDKSKKYAASNRKSKYLNK